MKKKFLSFGLILSCVTGSVVAQSKIVVVDTTKVLAESEQAKDLRAELQATESERGTAFRESAQQLEAERKSLTTKARTANAEALRNAEKNLMKKERELKDAIEEAQQELSDAANKSFMVLQQEVLMAVEQWRVQQGIDLVVPTASILAFNKNLEQTDEFIAYFNKQYVSTKGKAKVAPATKTAVPAKKAAAAA